MPESEWEQRSKSRTRLIKWTLIILLLAGVAGIIIHNNRDVISSSAESGGGDASFSVAGDPVKVKPAATETHKPVAPPPVKKRDPAPAGAKAIAAAHKMPVVDAKPAAKPATAAKKKAVVPAKTFMVAEKPDAIVKKTAVAALKPFTAEAKPKSQPAVARGYSSIDSVEINDVICRAINRNDIQVNISLILFCGQSRTRDVLVRRDALAVVTQKVIGKKDLEEIKIGTIKDELLRGMNALFDNTTLTDIKLRSITIEKASPE